MSGGSSGPAARLPGTPPALRLAGIDKAFDGKPALTRAGFTLAWGEVHALVGENGAGKSTLMNVATGVYAADRGDQTINGVGLAPRSPMEATAAGLGMVHQHFRLVESFSVAENVLLALGASGAARTVQEAAALVSRTAQEIGLPVDPHRSVESLSIADRQRAEIVKVLLLGARILVLDEPTAVLTEEEGHALLSFVRRLAERGNAVVLITHKFREVAGFCDRVTVMRHGATVLDGAPVSSVSEDEIARLIVGETLPAVSGPNSTPGAVCLEVTDLHLAAPGGGQALAGLGFELRAAEVLGIAGVGGNGQEELMACLMGLALPQAGRIVLSDADITRATPRERRRAGLRAIPADRLASGLIAGLSIAGNLALTHVAEGVFGPALWLDRRRMRRRAAGLIDAFDIRGATPGRDVALLSGGNAQKVLLARELDDGLKLLIAHSPARGLDMKATGFVRDAIRRAVEAGAACLLISEDLSEVLSLSHRVAVMNRGRLVGTRPTADVSPEWIGALLAGHA